ncbi:MAG: universal stress protein [Planctomycetia bacterium]|nr:universal stress protein [Planctomycetia bacterium]
MLPIHTILHPTDFSDRSWSALQLACSLARDYHARLVLLHVLPLPVVAFGEGVVPADPEEFIRDAQSRLDGVASQCDRVEVEKQVESGDPVEVILGVAQERPADLIVMGTHGRTGLRRLIMGSVAEQVVRRASCPVLTVTAPFPAGVTIAEPALLAGV